VSYRFAKTRRRGIGRTYGDGIKKNHAEIKTTPGKPYPNTTEAGFMKVNDTPAASGSLSDHIAFPATDRPIIAKRDLI
jgi:hypothetical protein